MRENGAKDPKQTVLVAGAGLGGALMAVYLARAGYDVRVYEQRGDPRAAEGVRGRSINLAISTRGLAALRGVGLEDRILELAVPMRGRMIHGLDRSLISARNSGLLKRHRLDSPSSWPKNCE